MSSSSGRSDAQRLAAALRDQLYIVATHRDHVTVAISNDLGKEHIQTHVERVTEGHNVDFEIEHAGEHDENNDRWRIQAE